MGNTNNKQHVIEGQLFEHPRLGKVKVLPSGSLNVIEYEVRANGLIEVEEWNKRKMHVQNSETQQVILLPLRHSFEKAGICGQSGIVKVLHSDHLLTYEQYMYLLASEIQNRRHLARPFLEREMWYLLFTMVRAGKQYERVGRKIGDVRPQNVLINEDGMIKMISEESWPGQSTNFELVVQSRETITFLAPQQCIEEAIIRGEYPRGVNPNVAEVFSIGLTLLESGTLLSCDYLYTRNPYSLDFRKLQQFQEALRPKYTKPLYRIIDNMLQPNPMERPTCTELYGLLLPYQSELVNLDEFTFNEAASENSLRAYMQQQGKIKPTKWHSGKLFDRITSRSNPTGNNNNSYQYR